MLTQAQQLSLINNVLDNLEGLIQNINKEKESIASLTDGEPIKKAMVCLNQAIVPIELAKHFLEIRQKSLTEISVIAKSRKKSMKIKNLIIDDNYSSKAINTPSLISLIRPDQYTRSFKQIMEWGGWKEKYHFDSWQGATSYAEAIAILEQGCPECISFDYDLDSFAPNGDELTGLDIAKWIANKDLTEGGSYIPKNFTFKVHSQNPEGKQKIIAYLDNYLKKRKKV